mmetsp:Transcript_9078/g.14352  ORF Transcript_9078/g.14352 Transcript_9078/m.14352 type:complete len:281 (+) Transcript_9078:2090-2932(+)
MRLMVLLLLRPHIAVQLVSRRGCHLLGQWRSVLLLLALPLLESRFHVAHVVMVLLLVVERLGGRLMDEGVRVKAAVGHRFVVAAATATVAHLRLLHVRRGCGVRHCDGLLMDLGSLVPTESGRRHLRRGAFGRNALCLMLGRSGRRSGCFSVNSSLGRLRSLGRASGRGDDGMSNSVPRILGSECPEGPFRDPKLPAGLLDRGGGDPELVRHHVQGLGEQRVQKLERELDGRGGRPSLPIQLPSLPPWAYDVDVGPALGVLPRHLAPGHPGSLPTFLLLC